MVTRKDYGEVKEERLLNGLRTALISESHDPITAGHRDDATTTANIRKNFWWKGMTTDVETFCKACILCAIAKSGAGKGILVGWGIEPPRLACIHIDYCGPFPTTRRWNRFAFAMVDRATGWIEIHPTVDCKATTAAHILLNQWVPRYGCSKIVVSDNGKHFTAQSFEESTKALGMRLRHTTAYHPQSNGTVERRFRDMGRAIRIFGTTHGEWDEILPIFALATRNKMNKTTGHSPAMLLFGEELRLPTAIDAKVETWYDQSTELYKLFERRRLVEEVIKEKKLDAFEESQKKLEDRFKEINWEVGQQVFCYVDRRTVGQSSKGLVRWNGPFEILEVRQSTLVISRNGKRVTINQTQCISVTGPKGPTRG